MSKLLLARLSVGILLVFAGTAQASIHAVGDGASHASHRSQEVADSALPKTTPGDAKLFSNAMLDPAHCNYEYVEMYGTMVVRTELKMTCTMHR
jgi:hypothetical protein